MTFQLHITKKVVSIFCLVCLAASYSNASATFEGVKAAVCGVPQGNFNTATLTKQNAWSYKMGSTSLKDKCLKSSPTASVTNCEILMSFCHAYNCSDTDSSLMNTTACVDVQEVTGNKTYKLGSYDANVNQLANDPDNKDSKFLAHFINGGVYNGTGQSCNLSMDIEFDCNRDLVWQSSTQKKADISSAAVISIDFDTTKCKYTLRFSYGGACPPEKPVQPSENLSFGTVLLIIFFSGLIIYFLFGSILKYCFGSRGREIIPQYDFWTMLPVYIADGFIFTCTCGKAGGDRDSKYDSI